MAIALLIIQGLLGLVFIFTGSFKFFQSKEKVVASGGAWAEGFKPGIIKFISGMELVCGLWVIAGLLLERERLLAGAGAVCISLIMAGSIIVHIRRKEYQHAAINAVLLAMAGVVAYEILNGI